MERMKEGKEELNIANPGPADLDALMKNFEALLGPDGAEGLDKMMEQMLSKEIMYEPMRDMGKEYPPYLARNATNPSDPDEFQRAQRQYDTIKEIVALYEKQPGEPDEAGRKRVAELMQIMQDLGNPPAEIVKAMAPEMEVDADGRPKMPNLPGMGMPGMPGMPDLDVPEFLRSPSPCFADFALATKVFKQVAVLAITVAADNGQAQQLNGPIIQAIDRFRDAVNGTVSVNAGSNGSVVVVINLPQPNVSRAGLVGLVERIKNGTLEVAKKFDNLNRTRPNIYPPKETLRYINNFTNTTIDQIWNQTVDAWKKAGNATLGRVPEWLRSFSANESFTVDAKFSFAGGVSIGQTEFSGNLSAQCRIRGGLNMTLAEGNYTGMKEDAEMWNTYKMSFPLYNNRTGLKIVDVPVNMRRRVSRAGGDIVAIEQRMLSNNGTEASKLRISVGFATYPMFTIRYWSADKANNATAIEDFNLHFALHRVVEYTDFMTVAGSDSFISLLKNASALTMTNVTWNQVPGNGTVPPLFNAQFALVHTKSGATITFKISGAPQDMTLDKTLGTAIPRDGLKFDFQVDSFPFKYNTTDNPRIAVLASITSATRTRYFTNDTMSIGASSFGQLAWTRVATAAYANASSPSGLTSTYVTVTADAQDVVSVSDNEFNGEAYVARNFSISYVAFKFDKEAAVPAPVSLHWDPQTGTNQAALDVASADSTLSTDYVAQADAANSTPTLPVAAIVGIVVGGTVVIGAVAGIAVFMSRKKTASKLGSAPAL
ncbi:hypothetical protein HDU93_006539 [Gonapodya sp. JEL0774]|nr:hypothetical protein HDU93_006539 [Gonapodya sp. JEL0774]